MREDSLLIRDDERPLPFSAIDAVAQAPVMLFRYRNRPNAGQQYIGPDVSQCSYLAARQDPENALGVDLHSLVGVLWAAANELLNSLRPLQKVAADLPGIVAASDRTHASLHDDMAVGLDAVKSWAAGQIASQVGAETSSRVAAQSAMMQAVTGAMSVSMADERALRVQADVDEKSARETGVAGALATTAASVASEAATRASADTVEKTAREAADLTLQSAIVSETTSRQQGDTALQAALDSEVSARQTLAGRVTATETAASALTARVAALEARKPVLWRAVGNLPTLAVNATADVTCTWTSAPSPLPDASQVAVVLAPGLGNTTATTKSVSASGVTCTIKAGLAITASTGAVQIVAATSG